MQEKRTVLAAPDSLVIDGKIQFGVFDRAPRNVNMLDADFLNLAGATPRFARRMRLKQWQFYSISTPEVSLGVLIIDLAFVASSFVYAYEREKGIYHEHSRVKLDTKRQLASNLYSGKCFFYDKNYSVQISNNLDKGFHEIKIEAGESREAPAIEADIKLMQTVGANQPLVVSLPVGANRGMYSHKAVCPTRGQLRIGDKEYECDASRDVGLMDEHKAFYPRHTYWKWAMLGFIDEKGRTVGANLTDNLIKDQDRWNENAIYCGDTISLLGSVRFRYDRRDMMKPWTIFTDDERVELEFIPEGIKSDKTNALIVNIEYYQPYGVFRGKLVDDAGTLHEVRDVFGITEYHNAYY